MLNVRTRLKGIGRLRNISGDMEGECDEGLRCLYWIGQTTQRQKDAVNKRVSLPARYSDSNRAPLWTEKYRVRQDYKVWSEKYIIGHGEGAGKVGW